MSKTQEQRANAHPALSSDKFWADVHAKLGPNLSPTDREFFARVRERNEAQAADSKWRREQPADARQLATAMIQHGVELDAILPRDTSTQEAWFTRNNERREWLRARIAQEDILARFVEPTEAECVKLIAARRRYRAELEAALPYEHDEPMKCVSSGRVAQRIEWLRAKIASEEATCPTIAFAADLPTLAVEIPIGTIYRVSNRSLGADTFYRRTQRGWEPCEAGQIEGIRATACECGSAYNGGFHSFWCPAAV